MSAKVWRTRRQLGVTKRCKGRGQGCAASGLCLVAQVSEVGNGLNVEKFLEKMGMGCASLVV